MKKNYFFILIFLFFLSEVNAINIAVDCNIEKNNDKKLECNETNPIIAVSYYLSNVKVEDKLDGIAVRLDYNSSMLTFNSIRKNKIEFIESRGAKSLPFVAIVDDNTIDTGIFIIGNCFKEKTCPIGNGTSLTIEFSCKKEGKIDCSSFNIIDTKDKYSKTWWSNGDFEYGGKKKTFENQLIIKDDKKKDYNKQLTKKENIILKPIKLIISWLFD